MFKPMAQTVMFAVIGALILSLTYVPMISSLVLSKKIKVRETISDKIVKLVKRIYMPILNAFLRRQKTVLAGLGALIVISIFLFSRLGAEFIPSLDEGDFAVETRLITGTSLTKTIEATSKVSDVLLKNFPEVKEVVGKIGTAEIPTDPMPMEACDLMVILKDKDEWTSASTKEELAEKMQKTLENNVPGVSFGFLQPIQMRFNELMTGAKQDVVVKIYGEDLDKLSHYAGQIGTLSSKIEGVQDVYVEEVTGLPQMIVSYNREALSKYNISIDEVNRSINISFAGQAAGLIFEGEKRFDLVVKLDSTNRQSMEDLKTITVTSPLGVQVPLEQLADVKFEKGPNQIQRDDAKRRIIVGFNVRGRDVESIVKELQAKIAGNVHFEPGYFPTYGGTFKNLENARNRLAIAVPVALFMIFFLLYLTFQSLKQAALIFSAIPLAALGGILALWSRGMPFSISAGVGFIALFGVAVLNGIVLISEFNSLKKEGYTNRLRIVLMGTRVRLRPVMLTALVASLGFLPMALSHGSGAEVQKPLATVVIGGLITATILTLFVLPIFYLFSERKMKVKKRKPMVMTLLFMLSFSLFGQTPQVVTLEQCLSMAKENNPSLKAAEMQIQKEVMIGKSMAEMPKTSVTGMMGQYNSYYSRDNNISVSQSIPFPTVFVKERELGQVRSEQAKVVLFSTWKELALQIESTYESIVLLKNKELLLKRQDSLYTELDKRYAIKYELKDVTHLDAVLVSSKKKEVQNALLMNAQEIVNLERQLMFLTGASSSLSADNSSKSSLMFVDKKDSSVFTAHPQQQYFQTQRMILEKQKEVLLARTLPDITIGYVNQTLVGVHSVDASTDKVFDQSSRFQAGQVGLQIPLFFGASRKKSQVLTNELNQNELNGNYAKQELQSTYLSLLGKYASLLESLNMYDSQLIPQTKIMNDQGKIMLESGEISMIEFLQTKQAIIDIEMNYINLKSEINTTVHQLNWFVQNEN
jgi:cobalt-zinc-cadmium resistance protein CzcA